MMHKSTRYTEPPQPFGWRICDRDSKAVLRELPSGYAYETDAWTAGGKELEQFFKAARRAK
jgi:hypothetical protein